MWDINRGQTEFLANPQWEKIKCTAFHANFRPQPIANHTSVVYNEKMYLFGGVVNKGPNTDMYSLELKNQKY